MLCIPFISDLLIQNCNRLFCIDVPHLWKTDCLYYESSQCIWIIAFSLLLRFIPDNVTFDDKPKDAASEVNVSVYKPKYFTSAAMGTSKVSLQCFHNVFLICLVLLSAYKW